MVSLVERGHGDRVSFGTLRSISAAVDARLVLQLRWRAGDLDRLLDADHAILSAAVVRLLTTAGWEARVEVTYTTRVASGSIDILGWHRPTRTLLVIEVKTEIPSAEATLRKLDEKVTIAAGVARDRFGWQSAAVSRLLVMEDSSTNRRRLAGHMALFDAALPTAGIAVRRWLRDPVGVVSGRMFLSSSDQGAVIRRAGGRHRVRRASGAAKRPVANVGRDESAFAVDDPDGFPTILVGYERSGR